MPFCMHGEPNHKCRICQAARGPDAVAFVKPLLPTTPVLRPVVMPKPVVVATVTPLKAVVVVPRVLPVPVLPGAPPSVLVNGVSKPGPVSSGLPIVPNLAVRGGGVTVNQKVVEKFWAAYAMLGVTNESAETAVLAAIRDSGAATVDGFDSLELAEKFALYKYTSVEFLKWNAFLRGGKGNYSPHCDLVSAALSKLQPEAKYATTYRIEKFSESRHLPFFRRGTGATGSLIISTEINFAAFSSTAFEIEKVERDPQFSGAGSYVKYVISGHAGKRVNFLSLKPDECEILIDKGAKFRITSGPDQKFAFEASRRSGAVEIRIEQM